MFNTIKNAIKTPDTRKRLLYTLLLLVIFRLGCYITVPMVDISSLNDTMGTNSNSVVGLINMISGGAFSRLSVFAMSITPYITASIVIQLMSMVIPSLERLTKEGGEEGRKKIDRYTKIISLILAVVEAVGIYFSYRTSGLFVDTGFLAGFVVVLSLVAGTSLLMWLGDKITSKGVGNGISMIIFAGIVSGIPSALVSIFSLVNQDGQFSTLGLIEAILMCLGILILVIGVVFVQLAERRIPVQYSKRVVGRKMMGAQNTHIPIKPAMASVMPIIFASSFMTFPAMVIELFVQDIENQTGFLRVLYDLSIATSSSNVGWQYLIINAIIYLLLIIGFTYFYTYATFNPAEVANNIKQNGGFIPGIRAGKPTADYLSSVLSKVVLFGGIFLASIAILPMFAKATGLNTAFGGTSILIVVGVAIELSQQLQSLLVMKHYKGFLEK
ncbi:MAG: preprotein translocase subunit SecY [Clostridia bacterium]|nr:preprotein translocase subunit SecY [Clostridia bacterium]